MFASMIKVKCIYNSVGSVFSSDYLDTSARQVPFSLATLAKISINETIIQIVPAVVCINGLGCGGENCTGFPIH